MMKKRLKKVLALGMAAAMLAGAPLPAMAAEAAPADAAVTAETQPEIAMQAADEDAAGTALPNGVDPLMPIACSSSAGTVKHGIK